MDCRKFIVAFLLMHQAIPSISQKIDGVYIGSIITESNAMVITTKAEVVNGNVYLTKYEKFTFLGTILKGVLEGSIRVPGGSDVEVRGKVYADSISLNLRSYGIQQQTTLIRISSKPNFDLGKVFDNLRTRRDPLLVGKWYLVRIIDSDGKELTKRKYFYEYLEDGRTRIDKNYLRDLWEEAQREAGSRANFDDRFIPSNTWETNGNRLVISSDNGTNNYTYFIKDDTLSIVNFKGQKEIMVKKLND